MAWIAFLTELLIHLLNQYNRVMQQYIKDGIIKSRNQIMIKGQRTIKDKDGNDKVVGMNTFNPTEDMLLADGWVEYIVPEPSAEQLLERARMMKLSELHKYDESSEVNDCIIVYGGQELHYWASKDERNDLKSAVKDCISVGRETYRLDLRDKGISLVLNCELLLQMMAALEVYAIDCYNKTTDHEFAIKTLATIEEVEAYDFKVGYPSIPRFEL